MHWLLRVGSGKEFIQSSKYSIWGVKSTDIFATVPFLRDVKEGDELWFVQSGSLLLAVATYTKQVKRDVGPLIAVTYTNEELGWKEGETCDTEVHYKDLYNLTKCELMSEIKSPLVIRKYSDKCKIDLPVEYANIIKYSHITQTML